MITNDHGTMNRRTAALLAVIGGNTIFGFSFIFSKLALQITMPSILIAARFLTAFALLNIIAFAGRRIRISDGQGGSRPLVRFSLRGKPVRDILLLALFQPILYFLCESYGIVFTSASFAGTIIAVIPIAGVVADVVIMHSPISPKQIICAVLSAAGVAVTTIGAEGMRSSALGLLLLMGAVVSGALFYVFSKRSGGHYNPLEQTYVMFAMGSLVYVIFAAVQCRGEFPRLVGEAFSEPMFLIGVLYLAVLSSVAAFILLNYGTVRVTVSEASIFANLTTVISIIAGVVFLHESFTLFQAAGAAIIVASVYAASRNGNGDRGPEESS